MKPGVRLGRVLVMVCLLGRSGEELVKVVREGATVCAMGHLSRALVGMLYRFSLPRMHASSPGGVCLL